MEMILPLLVVFGILGVVGAMVYIGMREDRGTDALSERLAFYGDNDIQVESLEEVELKLSFRDRVLLPIIKRLSDLVARLTPQKRLEATRKLLDMAGQNTDPTQLFMQQIVFTIALGLGGFLMGFQIMQQPFPNNLLWTLGGCALGYYFPILSVKSKISKRQNSVIKALPDALDLLVICVEAGLGFDAAMGKVYEKWDNELSLAFGRVLREIQLGKPRKDALKDMSTRMDVPDVNSFVAAIIQAEQLGVSMSKILRVQSDQMRVKRRQRAQEKAQQAPVKMMIPMVLLIFPSIWIVLLGPAVIQLMNTNAGGAF
ncbi:MAG: type II secretion system F family protein [Anaerolineae bacterium]|jgi:tight adherence protein C|nr:type II secretion system F family protein [Anaerolineae bacterium]